MSQELLYTKTDLKTMQAWPLQRKIQVTQTRIMEWHRQYNGQVYVSFSGGKDSTVLLDLVRRIYPDIPAVFVDTGLEYPEIRQFVNKFDNVEIRRPEMNFREVIATYGYPVVSKQTSYFVRQIRTAPETTRNLRLYGISVSGGKISSRGKLPNKWKRLVDAPFLISEMCCDVMKKKPLKRYAKETGRKPMTGQMACESDVRTYAWLKHGCNFFKSGKEMSNPLSFWTEQDILQYLKITSIPYAPVYGDIVKKNPQQSFFEDAEILTTTGCKRTGCMFCTFGVVREEAPNRFEQMKSTYPKQYAYCINGGQYEGGFLVPDASGLGIGKVLDYIGIPY